MRNPKPYRRLTEEDRKNVKRRLDAGEREETLAVEFDVHFNTIRNVNRGIGDVNKAALPKE